MGAAASCFSSQQIYSKKYDVFISFRGEDTRDNFLSHLHYALCQKSIRTYVDYELPRGEDISESLIQAIHDSTLSLVVFSQNYASSKWCLEELIQILKCREDQGQFVIPIFYKVDPSDVRKQNGTYREAFTKHEQHFIHNLDKVNKWKHALSQTANLAGWDSHTFRDESELIRNIINDVLQKLDHQHSSPLRSLVGIDDNCACIESLLEEVPVIGIWGMGGIGKTTMAKVVFAKLSPQFESCCFMENIREEEEKHGLQYIRDKLVSELLKEENILINTTKVLESPFIKRRLRIKKVFIVLDDVNNSKQLDDLIKEYDGLGPGSKVIIITRDKHVLVGRVDKIYKPKELNYQDSLKLFSFNSFQNDHPNIGFEQLSERAVVYAKGIPLALIVLGLFLRSRTKEEWENALTKFKKAPHKDILNVFRSSYDVLDEDEKQIFLDIACFLKGEDKECVIRILNSYGFNATIGIQVLLDKALITMDKGRVWMHDLIQEMGWEIVHEESINEPGRRSRLCDLKEVYNVLKNNQGTDAVQGIILDVSQIRDLNLSANTFEKMPNIRFLKFYSSWKFGRYGPSNVYLPKNLKLFFNKLRYFEWYGYSLESLPSTFCVENLVKLSMPNSHVQTLWEGVQDVVNLKSLDLSECRQLRELPNLSKAKNLEKVFLQECQSLCYIHPSILSLHSLISLNVMRCKRLKSLQSETHLRSLERVSAFGCLNLKEFSLTSEELNYLNLCQTGIEILQPSIGRLSKLRELLLNCSQLKNFPIKELCCLKSLKELTIQEHTMDKPELYMLFDALYSLEDLCFNDCLNLIELPNNIKQLPRLRRLRLSGCRNLQCLPELPQSLEKLNVTLCSSLRCLPELPPSIKELNASDCTSLEIVRTSTISRLLHKRSKAIFLSVENCVKLNKVSISAIMEHAEFSLKEAPHKNHFVDVHYPGNRVPMWFKQNLTTNGSITIQLSLASDNLLGFVFCIVVPPFIKKGIWIDHSSCLCHFEDGEVIEFPISISDPWAKLCLGNVLLNYDPMQSDKFLTKLKGCGGNDEDNTCNPNIMFEFMLNGFFIKKFGVIPIYASGYHKFVQQRKLLLKLPAKRKRQLETHKHKCKKLKFESQDIDVLEDLFMRISIR